MSVPIVKSKMNMFALDCNKTVSNINNLINILNNVTDETSGSINGDCLQLINTFGTLIGSSTKVYNDTSVELHLLFKGYNKELDKLKREIPSLINKLIELGLLANTLYTLYLMSIAMEGFLEYSLNVEDLKQYIPMLQDFKMKVQLIMMATNENNKILIVGRRG